MSAGKPSRASYLGRILQERLFLRQRIFWQRLIQKGYFGKDIARKIISPTENFLANVNPEKVILGRILQERVFL